ncbi:MAG: serine hydrolase [Microcoleus sp. SIO2G3]|nr:serine hydrolase [Microcoleus sp. SIO2G3]
MSGTIPVARSPVGRETRRVRQSSASVSPQSKKARSSRHSQKRPLNPFIHIIRLLILGVGIGAIVGTLLSALNPATQASDKKVEETPKAEVQKSPSDVNTATPLALSQEIPELKAQLQTLAAEHPTLQPGVFLVDLDTGAYLDWQSNASFAAASTIKVPILVAFFQDVDKGKIRLDELLTMQPEMIAAGSGDLQYKQAGTQFTALEVATKMIIISDNTATNMLITRLGGAAELNARFRSWGLTATSINSPLPDVAGTNTTSPKDLGSLMSLVNQGELVSLRSRDRLLDIMQRTQTNTLLPQGLGAGAIIAHKTGNIGSLLADVGLVDMPTGKRYLVAVMVKRPHNDATAEELIRQISRTVYDYFNQPRVTPSTTLTPSEGTATISQTLTSEDSVN